MIARLRTFELTGLVPHARGVEIAAFLSMVAASWPLMLLAGPDLAPLVALFVPGIAAILLTRHAGDGIVRTLGLRRLGWPDAYLYAYWLPILFAIGTIGLTVAFGAGRLDSQVGGILPGNGLGPTEEIVQEIAGSLTVAPLVNMFVMLGTEMGWRAYLLPRLLPLGTWRAIACGSVLWAVMPTTYAASGVALATLDWSAQLVQVVWCVLIGAILGWLYVRTRSVWAPTLFAGAVGATSWFPALVLRDVVPLLGGSVSVIGWVLPAAVVLFLLPRLRATD